MVSDGTLVFLLIFLSLVYGRFIYIGETIRGVRDSLALLLSFYIAGEVLLKSESRFWGLLVFILVFYLTAVGYYSFLDIQGKLEEFLSSRETPTKTSLKDSMALIALIILFGVFPGIAVYVATRSIVLSITVDLGTSLFFFTLPDFDKKVFGLVFNAYTVLVVVSSVLLAFGLFV